MKIYADDPWSNYVFKMFANTYSFGKLGDFIFSYKKDTERPGIVIFEGNRCDKNLIFDEEQIPIYHANTKQILKGTIVAYYDDGTPAISYNENTNTFYLSLDIIKTSFLLLSRAEEENTPKDKFGRFQAKYSLNKHVESPLVNIYFDLLYRLLKKIFKKNSRLLEMRNCWPGNALYAVCLTHDVDIIYKWHMKKIGDYVLRKKKVKEVICSVGRKEFWNFEKIMDLEDDFGYRSTFFFLASKRDIIPRYNVKRLKKVVHRFHEEGWEIGLHTGFYSYNDYNKMLNEKQTLEKVLGEKIYGVRNHYIRFNAPESWQIQQKCGFSYDSTIGFREKVGFRSGLCTPYYPYDFKNDKTLDIIELPMTIMDHTIYVYNNPYKILDKCIETVKRFNGLLVVNWHQSSFDEKDKPEYTKMYKIMLDRFKRDNAFIATCQDVAEWWKKRKNI